MKRGLVMVMSDDGGTDRIGSAQAQGQAEAALPRARRCSAM